MLLYRAVDLAELRLLFESGMRSFPPRRPEQPIFYPVLTLPYAEQMARDWNAKAELGAGYVTQFVVDDEYVKQFEPKKVGDFRHIELWVPAEDLPEFNAHILGQIVVVRAYFRQGFAGVVSDRFGLKGKNAEMQFVALSGAFGYSRMDFYFEVIMNNLVVFLHYPFWSQFDFSEHGIANAARDDVLAGIRGIWSAKFPEITLSEVAGGSVPPSA